MDDFEEKFAALLDDPKSALLIINISRYAYLGTIVLGFVIMAYIFFGITTIFYVILGAAISASIGYAAYKLVFERMMYR